MNQHLINHDATILEALEKLNALSGSAMTLFVTGVNGIMTGTLTDGDIRRGLLGGASPQSPVSDVMNCNFCALHNDKIDLYDLRRFREKGVRLIPCLDYSGRVVDFIDTAVTRTRIPASAIIMAGGRGERLRPLTLTTPKPLLDVGGKPIIDHNVEALAAVGIKNIFVTTNYLADKLEEHFSKPIDGVEIKCVREPQFLGTIGSAALVDLPDRGCTIVMNSDLLTDISFEDMYLTHIATGADITVAAIPYNVAVPYAILEIDGDCVTGLSEKPSYAYYANAGIYVVNNRLLRSLAPNVRTDATELIELTISAGNKVGYFPITGTWIDIGSPSDFARAREIMRHRTI